MVFLVPKNGIKINTGKKVPAMLPIVEIEKTSPASLPMDEFPEESSLIIKGLTQPSSIMGKINNTVTVTNDPPKIKAEAEFRNKGNLKSKSVRYFIKKGKINK